MTAWQQCPNCGNIEPYPKDVCSFCKTSIPQTNYSYAHNTSNICPHCGKSIGAKHE